MFPYKKILVFGAHPDDEITMAGTIAKLASEGVKVSVVNMTNGCEGYSDLKLKNKIVKIRKLEAKKCDRVLGISYREILDIPDMNLTNDKKTLKTCIKLIRKIKPDAIFTHGPRDKHKDHCNTHYVTKSAWFHAGEPVAIELGSPWRTPYLYYYKGVETPLPSVVYDVTDFAEKKFEALATQISQFDIFRKTKEDFERQIFEIKKNRPKVFDRFWIAEDVILEKFL